MCDFKYSTYLCKLISNIKKVKETIMKILHNLKHIKKMLKKCCKLHAYKRRKKKKEIRKKISIIKSNS